MKVKSNVAIIYSEESRQAFIAGAKMKGLIYQFQGSHDTLHWLLGGVAYLAVNGAANLLRRLGVKFDILKEEECSEKCLGEYHTVLVPNACCLSRQAMSAIGGWLEGDVMLVVTGRTNLPNRLLNQKTVHLTTPVFEYAAGILQGSTCMETARKLLGGKANFHVDRLAWHIKDALIRHGDKRLWQTRLKLWGRYDNVLILRHDTDAPADPSYLDYEIANRIPATYSILPDKNMEFYLSRINGHDFLESAYHFTTATSQPWLGRVKPNRKAITGKGLAKQVKEAEKRLGVPISTIHRHWGYFYYPETIEAMDYLYETHPEIIGMGTMFRFTSLMYSAGELRTVEHHDISVPFWFPFKMMISATERHRPLRGWDITHRIEPPPSFIDTVFEEASTLPGGVYMFGFHPAHAKRDSFIPGGNYPWFLYSLGRAKEKGWWITNYRELLAKLNDWEDINFRVNRDGSVTLGNDTDREITDIVVSFGGEDTITPVLKAHSVVQVEPKHAKGGQNEHSTS